MPPTAKQKVLIVGAGPTGLTAACELARRGIDIKVIDKAASPCDQSRALAVHARTLELLDDMGIAGDMIADGLPVSEFDIYDVDKRLAKLDLTQLDSQFQFLLVLPQSKTEGHLREYLSRLGGSVQQSTELLDIQAASNCVMAKLKHEDGTEAEERFDWLIGCDGAHSAVRHALNLPFEGGKYNEKFVLADVQLDSERDAADCSPMAAYTGKRNIVAIFQINEKLFRVIGILPPNTVLANPEAPSLEEMQQLVNLYRPDLRIHSPVWLASFNVSYRRVNQYRVGRVFLAGDSAHIHSPAGGQGMNTGMQDAVNLAWKLALTIDEGAHEKLLDSYEAERLPVAKAVLAGTNFLTRANVLRSPVSQQIRRHLAPVLVAQKPIQHKIVDFFGELSIAYRSSPIVFQHQRNLLAVASGGKQPPDKPGMREWFEFGSGPAAGERAPDAQAVDARTQRPIRLFEAFKGTKHCLLLLIGQRSPNVVLQQLAPLAHAVEQKFGRLVHSVIVNIDREPPELLAKLEAHVLFDREFAIHKRYGAGAACVYLIRPDGYVGYRGQPPELSDLEFYFRHYLGIEVE
jgi:2-polyprenyl-6-methoxyphenol hydroxylase-like FAD-dependent oxidoreductase